MSKVSREAAEKDFAAWLDHKKVRGVKRAESKGNEQEIVSAIEDGILVVEEDFTITHMLCFPIEDTTGKVVVDKLVYKPRINVGQLSIKLKPVGGADVDGRIAAYAATLADVNTSLINKLDTEDQRIVNAIVMYFL